MQLISANLHSIKFLVIKKIKSNSHPNFISSKYYISAKFFPIFVTNLIETQVLSLFNTKYHNFKILAIVKL